MVVSVDLICFRIYLPIYLSVVFTVCTFLFESNLLVNNNIVNNKIAVNIPEYVARLTFNSGLALIAFEQSAQSFKERTICVSIVRSREPGPGCLKAD